jgi:hypothetical protein
MEQTPFQSIINEITWFVDQAFWAGIWVITAVCLLSLVFAVVEGTGRRQASGDAPMAGYSGEGRTLGITLMLVGIGGLALTHIAWGATFGDAGRVFPLLFQRLRDVTDGGQITILSLAIVSLLAFDFGVYKFLGSEVRAAGPAA